MDTTDRADALLDRLRKRGYVRTRPVEEALRHVPRDAFVETAGPGDAYRDAPLPIGRGQTISAPHMVAIMLEALQLEPGQKVLEVGTGSGYHAALIGEIVGPKGRVVTLEYETELADRAGHALKQVGASNVQVVQGDGGEGWPKEAPYDRINVTCAAPEIPSPVADQTKVDGLILIPIGRHPSALVRATRTEDGWEHEDLGACAFVPLRGPHGFHD